MASKRRIRNLRVTALVILLVYCIPLSAQEQSPSVKPVKAISIYTGNQINTVLQKFQEPIEIVEQHSSWNRTAQIKLRDRNSIELLVNYVPENSFTWWAFDTTSNEMLMVKKGRHIGPCIYLGETSRNPNCFTRSIYAKDKSEDEKKLLSLLRSWGKLQYKIPEDAPVKKVWDVLESRNK